MDSIKFKDVSEATNANYKSRLNSLIGFSGNSLTHMLKHPNTTYKTMIERKLCEQTIVNNIIAVIKVFDSNALFIDKYPRAFSIWKDKLAVARSKVTPKHKTKPDVDYSSMLTTDLQRTNHMKWLLLKIAIETKINPHRVMLGNVRLTKKSKREGNFVSLTSGNSNPEVLSKVVDIIKQSLSMFPRKYLFVDKSGKPYTKNNSYFKFVGRSLST